MSRRERRPLKTFALKRLFLPLLFGLVGMLTLPPAGATLQGLQVGSEAPDFQLKTLDGKPGGFADLHGEKLTVLLFWSTWSRNSEEALTRLEKLYRSYRDRGLSVVAINADGQRVGATERSDIAAVAERLDLSFPLLLDDGLQAFHDYGLIALPSMVVLDPQRTIRYELSGYPLVGVEEMVDFIRATLEGRSLSPEVAAETGYRPDPRALHYHNMGRKTLKARRMLAMAEMWFKKAIEADERFVEPRLSLARFYLDRDKRAEAAEQFSRVLELQPGNVVALCESAMILAGRGKDAEAMELLSRAKQEDPYYTPGYYYLGYLKGRSGALKEARALFEEALRINRTSPDIHIYRGRMHEERQEPEQAAEAYRKALEAVLGAS